MSITIAQTIIIIQVIVSLKVGIGIGYKFKYVYYVYYSEIFVLFTNICTIREYLYYSRIFVLFVFVFVRKNWTNTIRIRIRQEKSDEYYSYSYL